MAGERFSLSREEGKVPRAPLVGGRMFFRVAMIAAILWLAGQRGLSTMRLLLLAVAIVWALSLPLILRWIWRATAQRPPWQRYLLVGIAAVVLLGAFALGVQPLVVG